MMKHKLLWCFCLLLSRVLIMIKMGSPPGQNFHFYTIILKSSSLIGMKPITHILPKGELVLFGHSKSFTVELRCEFQLFTQNPSSSTGRWKLLSTVMFLKKRTFFNFKDLINVTTGITLRKVK